MGKDAQSGNRDSVQVTHDVASRQPINSLLRSRILPAFSCSSRTKPFERQCVYSNTDIVAVIGLQFCTLSTKSSTSATTVSALSLRRSSELPTSFIELHGRTFGSTTPPLRHIPQLSSINLP
ncbi:unnamed protein product [Zymoseptoria tritici ST99CH_1E4]|uniref:Uncharacterized protein n=1 Tax=Zymoseptoria tritici ST99CH_1E4 TaxID=1276532 RepID=A0A2H1H8Y1_ZYMTR|nr:unnamed protein product [Zymoseptoria tritici ST99CH_1E4]